MRVIFIKDLKNQAQKGDIKDVKDGYGRNFLIKNGYAVLETTTSVDILKKDKQQEQSAKEKEVEAAKQLKTKLEKEPINFTVKSGAKGKIFGSVSSKTIYDELTSKGYKIDRKKIKLKEPIQSLGVHVVEIEVYKNINANLNITVISG